uniref:Uncharacterized protein n=1 Tax=Myoviridae sp. ctgEf1 TaxID=2827699 RepID=A0A8S5SL63_9CAUD|nr:MAG TPA: hypothetical protein [Myoviridae sp. ctgEf1]
MFSRNTYSLTIFTQYFIQLCCKVLVSAQSSNLNITYEPTIMITTSIKYYL